MIPKRIAELNNVTIKLKLSNRELNSLLYELREENEETFYEEVKKIRDSNINTILAVKALDLKSHVKDN